MTQALSKRSWIAIAGWTAGLLLCTGTIIAVIMRPTPHRRVVKSTPAETIARRGIALPPPSGIDPPGLTLDYDASRDRSRMKLVVGPVAAIAPASFAVQPVTLTFTSEFAGRVRQPDDIERSVQCRAVATGRQQGFFAISSPPATFTAGTKTIHAKDAPTGVLPYKSVAAGGGFEERVSFRLRTEDLAAMTHGTEVTGAIGSVKLTLTAAQLASLREFAARIVTPPAAAPGG